MAYLSNSTLPYASLVTHILTINDVPFGSRHKSTALDPFDISTSMKMGLLHIPGRDDSDDEEMDHEDDPEVARSDEDDQKSDDGLDPAKGRSTYEPWEGSVGKPEIDAALSYFDSAFMNLDLCMDSIMYNQTKLAKGQKKLAKGQEKIESKIDEFLRRGRY